MNGHRRRLLTAIAMLAILAVILWGGGSDSCKAAQLSADTEVIGGEWINSTAHISTNFGSIIVMLADQGAPITTTNFIELANSSFYDNLKWHRIVDDFVIQTGDPNTKDNNPYNDGSGGSSQTIPLEINDSLTHVDGAIGMARSQDPDSASSQFYICDGAQHGLDGNYAVFGVVVEGIEVVRAIASVEVNGNTRPLLSQQPVEDVWLYSVRITYGHWNETQIVGPTEPVADTSGGRAVQATVLGMAMVAPLVISVVMVFHIKRRRTSK
jgi:peptidyl-prolyl cis-trans isomerase B (cyclophilin B)